MNQPIPDANPRVLGQLLTAYSAFSVFSDKQRMGEFIVRAAEGVPGILACGVCIRGGQRPRMDAADMPECAVCATYQTEIGQGAHFQCPLSNRKDIRVFPLQTQDEHYGFFLLKLNNAKHFALYEPFVNNLANSLAVNIERSWQKEQLEATNEELLKLRDHLQDLVGERTVKLQIVNDRLQHLNAVLRSIRGVNQLIVGESDLEHLVQAACECLIETRSYFDAWIALADPSGGLIPRGRAGADKAYISTLQQLGRTNELHCMVLSLNRPGVVTIEDPHAACSGCPLLQTMDSSRSAMAVRLEHRGRVFGVLVVSADRKYISDEEEHSLLVEVAEDIGLALHSLDQESMRKGAEQEIASLQAQFLQSQKMEAIGRLAGGIAHDFNNLLTVISIQSQLSVRGLREGDPLRENLQEIEKAADRAASLTRQLLAFSRRQILEMKVTDLNIILGNLEKMLYRVIGENIELKTVLTDDLGLVKVDPGQIEQVIMNLAVNAKDAMPQGGKLFLETANVELDERYGISHMGMIPGAYVMLSVTDTGEGMTKEIKEQIFDPFFTTKEKGKGTGLGLSTVYGIVKQSGGDIYVYSEPSHGTTFKIYFPRVFEPGEELAKKEAGGEVPRGEETILVVEDDGMVRKLAIDILRTQGYTVLEAEAGGEALLVCEQYKEPIDLILTDVVMPHMSGAQFIEQLKQVRKDFKVLYMTGYAENAITHHGLLEKRLNLIPKPFTIEKLARKVREVLDKNSESSV